LISGKGKGAVYMDAVIFFKNLSGCCILFATPWPVFFFLEHAGELHIIIIKEAQSLFYINFGYV